MEMPYRRLGQAGIKVSVLSFGSWVTFKNQVDVEEAAELLTMARESGVNFFDNAEAYAAGESERVMGEAIRALGWPRWSYLVSTKLFWGIHDDVNMRETLNRKYLLEGTEGSLERFGLDFVDLLYCHRPDPETSLEEIVVTMSEIVSSGRARYWGTSEWPAGEICAAWELADRHHLHKPVVEQPQYNLLARQRVEHEYAPVARELGIGLTTWSPLASGVLTGKYLEGVPAGSRAALSGYEWLRRRVTDPGTSEQVRKLAAVARRLDCSVGQLAIAWCARHPQVSSVILGASRAAQLRENLDAVAVIDRLDEAVLEEIDAVVAA